MNDVLLSDASAPFTWLEATAAKDIFGPKGAGLAALPRAWTLRFILVSASRSPEVALGKAAPEFWEAVRRLATPTGKFIVRSSVIGETIWDRGKYQSVIVDASTGGIEQLATSACAQVLKSAIGRPCGLVLQTYVEPRQRGEFGNLYRISKTRDHWELTTHASDTTIVSRINTQRDSAAPEDSALTARPRLSAERLFASVAAWINNVLIRGHLLRFNCEWVSDNRAFYLVQIDAEDEDPVGINPLQLTISPIHEPLSSSGQLLKPADSTAIAKWDKLKVLEDLWGASTENRPHLFVLPLSEVPSSGSPQASQLAADFRNLLGPDNIVVRTSVETGQPKAPNLPRTECLIPEQAAQWCIAEKQRLLQTGGDIPGLAFIAHRYIDARSSAWARADPSDPSVEIHGIWGLPDALQYCPYDIWEVHVPTESATEYPEYKSNILLAAKDGTWQYIRVKNEIARSVSISRRDAIDIARCTHEVAIRLGRPCHVMWFVGCTDHRDRTFNIPWYWTEAHESETNADRSRHQTFTVTNRISLQKLRSSNIDKSRVMVLLRPDHPDLFRDNRFISEVAKEARDRSMPIDLEGSTLAHAYYQLLSHGCTVIARGEKGYSRVRKLAPFGKIVRDKIPDKIAARRELEAIISVPPRTQEAFLIGKILEEALEVRESKTPEERRIELADLLEIIRAIAHANGLTIDDVLAAADKKREKLGGFERGQILLQTGIGAPKQTALQADANVAQVLSRSVGLDTKELPFTFFGFAELEQPRSLRFEDFGISLELTLKSDRLVVRMVREPEQLELPFSLEVDPGKGNNEN